MAATDVEVCNLALVKIGQREFITDLGENTVSAQVCSAVYSTTRDALHNVFGYPLTLNLRQITVVLPFEEVVEPVLRAQLQAARLVGHVPAKWDSFTGWLGAHRSHGEARSGALFDPMRE